MPQYGTFLHIRSFHKIIPLGNFLKVLFLGKGHIDGVVEVDEVFFEQSCHGYFSSSKEAKWHHILTVPK